MIRRGRIPAPFARSASKEMITLPGLRTRKVVEPRTPGELDAMAEAGALVASALRAVREAAVPGVSTLDLDRIAESVIRDAGGTPSFLGYHGFPASICSSVNDRVVHGIPAPTETLAAGDLVPSELTNKLVEDRIEQPDAADGFILDGYPR